MTTAVKRIEDMISGWATPRASGFPVPLVESSYDINIESGLAVVVQTRVFENREANPIEALMTFPVGYEAVVFGLEAEIDGRRIKACARRKSQARESYEAAMDDGKAAVLHEELIRGVHMLSVGNVKPGSRITVIARTVQPLAIVSGAGRLRVPLTVGAVYGASTFLPSDDLVSGGASTDAKVSVTGADGVMINGMPSADVRIVSTGHVIDLAVPSPSLPPLGIDPDNGTALRFFVPESDAAGLDIDVLVDASGSMGESVGGGRRKTKWQAVNDGLAEGFEDSTGEEDRVRLWTFSTVCTPHGVSAGGSAASGLVRALPFANGGTEIAGAIHAVAASRSEGNILLVTDGRSHRNVDLDQLRASGARVSVVLVGASALDARVGQIAAVTGGQMFVCDASSDISDFVAAALASMRRVATPIKPISGPEQRIERVVGGLGMILEPGEAVTRSRAAAAYAAFLRVSALSDEAAATIAEAAGIVSHLTSLVMIDEDGGAADRMAQTRKVALAGPDGPLAFAQQAQWCTRQSMSSLDVSLAAGSPLLASVTGLAADFATAGFGYSPSDREVPLGIRAAPAAFTHWNAAAAVVEGADKSRLGACLHWLAALAETDAVRKLAEALGMEAMVVAIAVHAATSGGSDRQAARIARRVLGTADPVLVEAAKRAASTHALRGCA